MGVVLPGWADELLDLIGVSWPNVDEDDYREMATAMREFADDIDDGATQAHDKVQALLGANEGDALEAFNAHWGKIKGTHLNNLAQAGRLCATAMDGVATLIAGAKGAALIQLGILAAEVLAAQVAAPFTLGLSELGALGATQATRVIVKRLFKEVCEQVAEHVISTAMTPIEESLANMAGDLVVQLAGNALGTQKGIDLSRTADAGKEGFHQGVDSAKQQAGQMHLLSAGGGGGVGGAGGSGKFTVDHAAYDDVAGGFERIGGGMRDKGRTKLHRAKGHQGRTRGKDFIADAANNMLDKVVTKVEQAVTQAGKHVAESIPQGLKCMSKNHRENDEHIAYSLAELKKHDDKTPMYLMGDDGTIRRLRADGNGTDALTEDDKKRLGLNFGPNNEVKIPEKGDSLARLPARKKGDREPRPRASSREVALGSTELARATQLARHAQGSYGTHRSVKKVVDGKEVVVDDFTSNNYAAGRFDGANGRGDFILVGRSQRYPNTRHSERMVGRAFLEDGMQGRMRELYTERAPCSNPNCGAWMHSRFPGVDVSHSVDYGSTKESRAAGNAKMMNYLDLLKARRDA